MVLAISVFDIWSNVEFIWFSTNEIVALPNIYESLAILIGLGSVSVAFTNLEALKN